MGQKRRLSNTIISFIIQRVHDLHISQIHLVCRSEFCVSIVIYFSWEYCYTQEESKTKVIQCPVKDAIGGGGEGGGDLQLCFSVLMWTGENYSKIQRVDAYFFLVNGKKISVFKSIWVRADET